MRGRYRVHVVAAVAAVLAAAAVGCSDGGESVLLSPSELGDDFAEETFDGPSSLPCGVELVPEAAGVEGEAAVSNRREQRIVQLVAEYERVEDAAEVYAATAGSAACEREENFAQSAGEPSPAAIP